MFKTALFKNLFLYILIFLLSLFLLFLFLYYKSFFLSSFVLSNKYSFLTDIIEMKSLRSDVSLYGTMVNLYNEDDLLVFDLEIWDTETRTSKYYKELKINPLYFSFEFETDYKFIPVLLDVKLKEEKHFGISKVEEVSFQRLVISEDEYNKLLYNLYLAITASPLKSPKENLIIEFQQKGHPYTFIQKDGSEYFPSQSTAEFSRTMYKPWIYSYLLNEMDDLPFTLNYSTSDIRDMLNNPYLGDLLEVPCEGGMCRKSDLEDDIDPDRYPLNTDRYQYSNNLSCTLLMQLLNNTDIDIDEITTANLCEYDYFKRSLVETVDELSNEFEYTISDYNQSLTSSRIKTLNNKNIEENNSSNIIGMLPDSLSLLSIYKQDDLRDDAKDLVINYVLWKEYLNIENICLIKYFADISNNENLLSEDSQSIRNYTRLFIESTPRKELLKYVEEDPYGMLLCVEEDLGNPFLDELIKAVLLKNYFLNYYDDDTRLGFWFDGEYDIRFNARMLKLFLLNKDLVL